MNAFWNNRRVFVTGGTGLVGSRLVRRLLDNGSHVIVLIRDADPQSELLRSGDLTRTTVVNGCLEDYHCLERAINEHEADTVFHLGAQTIVGTANRNPLSTFEANVRGTYNLLEAVRVHRQLVGRVLIASSDKAYGDCKTLPYCEDTPPLGKHPYDVSKSCTDLISHAYYNTYDLPIVVARCGNIYGGGDLNWSRIVPGTIADFHHGKSPRIRSDGKFLRDYVYVEDAVDAYLAMAAGADRDDVKGEAFNFGPGEPVSVLEIVNTIAKLMECTHLEPIILDEAQAEIRDQYLDSRKAHKILKWAPRYSLEDGLRETIDWYLQFLNN